MCFMLQVNCRCVYKQTMKMTKKIFEVVKMECNNTNNVSSIQHFKIVKAEMYF